MPADDIETWVGREVRVGSATVRRALPRRERRTVGAWCFVDHARPHSTSLPGGVGPHPHIGLQTVTWLLEGEILHRDGLGTEQLIRPGELNLMTAGHGIVHAEERTNEAPVHLVQLWVAQPEGTRHGSPQFEHHADLPRLELGDGIGTVLVGSVGEASSPARRDTDHVAIDVVVRSSGAVPVRAEYEHALIALGGEAEVEGYAVAEGQTLYLPPGRSEIALTARGEARILVLGGVPFDEPVSMWWNYVARDHAEISAAHHEWTTRSARFPVPASDLPPVDVGPPPWNPASGSPSPQP